ncbi:hypothetical protein METBIDRAFT_43624 [Metschnikowia bicuspidata var. bicuspidata NRRL YB-4993]|uniref:Glycosyltransferase family 91 protein n=1 Tax=Metschnikowia bicuspidata var. bicuspidata NRRL YB-4993 TaxID=869754 RepID=A0A1A0H929_9ASCO|nr:hypothetical protein METBIDRAFT_43624 [Metschnikowia bicuspidata var. bicuspidata NRRL YB-4993]OBA20388.1 hypothetical protein METBIDRAFT_43624 [Metschnikowia bicuspidata var. bicuspidata NRRL YB-4993]
MPRPRQRLAALACFLLALACLYVELRRFSSGLHLASSLAPGARDGPYTLRFPASFPAGVSKRALVKNTPAFRAAGLRYSHVLGAPVHKRPVLPAPRLWGTAAVRLFSAADIGRAPRRCAGAQAANASVAVAPARNLNADLAALVGRVIREIDRGSDAYVRELRPLVDPHVRLQAALGVVHRHWFHMAGSSVYLAEYGLHMMVSRVAYSPDGLRNNPRFSVAYAQLFDGAWDEVRDVALVVPSNMGAGARFFSVQGANYTVAHYPAILPVPFFHDPADPALKYLGPEDARVVLVQNAAGHREPLLVYNSQHQKHTLLDDDDDHLLGQPALFRSMFVCWPWQFQHGKAAVDGRPTARSDRQLYNRVKELRIKNLRRHKTQKNWTPLLSDAARAHAGHDSHVLFVYRWARLQILRCDISTDAGTCGFVFSAQPRLKVSSQVGPLRGGTPMVSLRSVLGLGPAPQLAELIPPAREVWVGFARAHLHECGCGKDFYRPNLVVLTADVLAGGKPRFRLSHLSSFTSLNVDVVPWDPRRPLDVCESTNAVIPNGISAWLVHGARQTSSGWEVDDLLSLSLSVSDCTVDIVHIHGLLGALVNLADPLPFLPPASDEQGRAAAFETAQGVGADADTANDHIICAMEESANFCAYYGMTVADRLAMASMYEDDYQSESEDEQMEKYRFALDELGLA